VLDGRGLDVVSADSGFGGWGVVVAIGGLVVVCGGLVVVDGLMKPDPLLPDASSSSSTALPPTHW